jgi:hypothetical protein
MLQQSCSTADPSSLVSVGVTKRSYCLFDPDDLIAERCRPIVKSYNSVRRAPGASQKETLAAKKTTKRVRREYTKADVKELRAHSKARTPVAKIAKLTKRTVGSFAAEGANPRLRARAPALALEPDDARPCDFPRARGLGDATQRQIQERFVLSRVPVR